ncbi:unnamed protein product, partial [Rotaria sp. Silwood2]
PLRSSAIDIHLNAKWNQNGFIGTGGNGQGNEINQLFNPWNLYVDDDQTIYVADCANHRVVEWKPSTMCGQVIAGGNGNGNGAHQLYYLKDVIIDKERDRLIIIDASNSRVVRWPRQNGTSGETIISNTYCYGLTMDENASLYVTDISKNEVRRYRNGDTDGAVVAGVYVSDNGNHRVRKWEEGAKQGIVVAGGQGEGNSFTQLKNSYGVVVDQLGAVYVTDGSNHRIMRWLKGATHGSVIVGRNGQGGQSNQLSTPIGLSFDRHGNLYVVENSNQRVQKFNIDSNL